MESLAPPVVSAPAERRGQCCRAPWVIEASCLKMVEPLLTAAVRMSQELWEDVSEIGVVGLGVVSRRARPVLEEPPVGGEALL